VNPISYRHAHKNGAPHCISASHGFRQRDRQTDRQDLADEHRRLSYYDTFQPRGQSNAALPSAVRRLLRADAMAHQTILPHLRRRHRHIEPA
jgi:hypothetical protein